MNRKNSVRTLRRRLQLCLAAATGLVTFCGLSSSAEAQLRTGRGVRDFYSTNNPDRESTDVPSEENGSQEEDSNRQVQRVVPKKRTVDSSVRPASHQSNVATPRTAAATTARRAKPTKQIDDSKVAQASCTSCQSDGLQEAGQWIEGEPMQVGSDCGCDGCVSGGACDSGCDAYSMAGNREVCIDLGCGPLGQLAGWLTRNMYIRGEAAVFSQDGVRVPILATTSNVNNVLFGNQTVNEDTQVGYRAQVGLWLDDCHDRALQFRMYDAGTWETNFLADASTVGTAGLVRPFFDPNSNPQLSTVVLVNLPTTATGSFNAAVSTKSYGGDLMLRKRLFQAGNARWDFLIGYQHARLKDALLISTQTTSPIAAPNTGLSVTDAFETDNRYEGMAWGLQRFSRWGNWSLDGSFKLGMGNMRRTVEIAGSQTVRDTANNVVTRGQGLLARNTNIGTYVEDTFAVSPEFGINLGYRWSRNLDLTVGYTYLSLPKVARAGDQIDPRLRVDLNTPVNFIAPAFNLSERDYTLQSFNFGAQWKF